MYVPFFCIGTVRAMLIRQLSQIPFNVLTYLAIRAHFDSVSDDDWHLF